MAPSAKLSRSTSLKLARTTWSSGPSAPASAAPARRCSASVRRSTSFSNPSKSVSVSKSESARRASPTSDRDQSAPRSNLPVSRPDRACDPSFSPPVPAASTPSVVSPEITPPNCSPPQPSAPCAVPKLPPSAKPETPAARAASIDTTPPIASDPWMEDAAPRSTSMRPTGNAVSSPKSVSPFTGSEISIPSNSTSVWFASAPRKRTCVSPPRLPERDTAAPGTPRS